MSGKSSKPVVKKKQTLSKEEMIAMGILNPGPDSTLKKVPYRGNAAMISLTPAYPKGT